MNDVARLHNESMGVSDEQYKINLEFITEREQKALRVKNGTSTLEDLTTRYDQFRS